ncbi:DNA cytosine methyltransferase [Pedobacter agri]|uniref:DNA (cytosine-5-)-methyltransferase n=1 Tax=Pedobacter agri TaxID=454586 RepID=A0A9X3I885_9SPHI|nr:DNA cytosine methyltransferase [Pedobacter agri]MCX3263714.1 DNA cytosine methyltransferase [Pedobacter agri]
MKAIPVIDLFAGPGGLAEGFSSLSRNGKRYYQVRLSIEMDAQARETLKLRAFLRQFPINELPEDYYHFLSGSISLEKLYSNFSGEHRLADQEAWQATLGKTQENEVDERIRSGIAGEKNWVLIGGPPCQAYSLVGRSRVGGIQDGDHRVHLYKEYLRIIAVHRPAVFVMENVKGLLSAKVNGEKIFDNILADLSDPATVFPLNPCPGYRIYSLVREAVRSDSDYLIKSELYGVPQRRHRVILLGIREDINVQPRQLVQKESVSLRSVISDLPKIRSSIYRAFSGSTEHLVEGKIKKKRNYVNLEDSYSLWKQHVSRYADELAELLPDSFRQNSIFPSDRGAEYLQGKSELSATHPLHHWYSDSRLSGSLNHQSRGHLSSDLKRYLFSALYTRKFGKFPRMADYRAYGDDLLPDHSNAESGKFNDRFRVQLAGEPATTITSHISKDGHYFIHYDPLQCRSLTVREAARIQTFPDNYFFCGSRTQQFHQVGNAVPPYLAFQIAEIVSSVLEKNKS